MPVTAVVGGQFGSEAKGAVVGMLAYDYLVHVRVGAANAGHTVYVGGEKFVLQQLPCAAYANPWAKCVLGAGALISEDVLEREVWGNNSWRQGRSLPALRLYIDHRAHVVQPYHKFAESRTGLAARIGSTSATANEGIGAAQAARVLRTGYRQVGQDGFRPEWAELPRVELTIEDTVGMLHDAVLFRVPVLLEGTQGAGLSNTTGFYPYVTSRNTTAAGLLADCGLGPRDMDTCLLVCRTFPIRVAGNSGPFWPDSQEISWEDIGVPQDQERTTVTKKVRRVASFSHQQVQEAVRINSASAIALTHADYLCPEIRGRGGYIEPDQLANFDYIGPMVRDLESATQVPVVMVGTAPGSMLVLDRSWAPGTVEGARSRVETPVMPRHERN